MDLKETRQACRLRQHDIAVLLDIHFQTYRNKESGKHAFKTHEMTAIEDKLKEHMKVRGLPMPGSEELFKGCKVTRTI